MPAHAIQILTLTSSYPAHNSPQVTLKFVPEAYWLVNTSASAVVACSFDGVDDNIILNAGDSISWPSNDRQLWAKKLSGSGTVTLQVGAAGREQ